MYALFSAITVTMESLLKKNMHIIIASAALIILTLISGCESERIVESTEYIERIEYINAPPDTVLLLDSIVIYDSTTVSNVDTVFRTDTVIQRQFVYDTVNRTDTVLQQQFIYDTTLLVDTVLQAQCTPNENLAFAALQYYADTEVLAFINAEFGVAGGWVLYMSQFQVTKNSSSPNSYQFSGVIDYWTTDWQQYYPLEFAWVVTYSSGDPANELNWSLSEPAPAPTNPTPGLSLISKRAGAQ